MTFNNKISIIKYQNIYKKMIKINLTNVYFIKDMIDNKMNKIILYYNKLN